MKLIILDFDKSIPYVYTIDEPDQLDMLLNGDDYVEAIMTRNGHRSSNCQWMVTKNEIIIKQAHKNE
jgi:hypothetical protein|tara:strand:- start:948 stop:1148 length:201 start_codon:yes stop_codon:yes gene_type:complete